MPTMTDMHDSMWVSNPRTMVRLETTFITNYGNLLIKRK